MRALPDRLVGPPSLDSHALDTDDAPPADAVAQIHGERRSTYREFEARRDGMIHAMDGGLWLHRHVWKGRPMAHLVSTDREALLAGTPLLHAPVARHHATAKSRGATQCRSSRDPSMYVMEGDAESPRSTARTPGAVGWL